MEILIYLGILLVSYLAGSVSFARIITKLWLGEDVTQYDIPVDGEEETHKAVSIGANTASTHLGAKGGGLVSLLDILKVGIPVFLAKFFLPDLAFAPMVAGIGGMAGHNWPIYYKFHGGAGYSSIMGGLLVLDPLSILATAFGGLILGMVVFRNMIVATVSWMWLLIPYFWLTKPDNPEYLIYAAAVNVLFILAMIPEIKLGLKYQKEGKAEAYGRGYLASNPMGKGYLKMAAAMGFMKKEDESKEEG